ncbi:acyl-phosphate glycerol-3-phosphate acyltransferase [Rubrobacter xylanophilus DSM 9941]|uniref:Glycerol-3-phosphate acyltransferase n=1 Tax=Rubrobacter xylanophilus (strain DSM 9941 / JCM 11954 / NBRC 16129 / PRD-1) TaxID=266117 RepID=Q1AZ13_RUBXD|nr:glycerol-3-phosphate acyltransferase [Rubrobacter xylanophilus]ABG03365.1 acyl-phosphate glycerol-3-phosphate acyltransferase [Rubrobacter xylanophilus DSM 9941]
MELSTLLEATVAFLLGYAAGSVPLGLLVAYLFAGIDIRRHGTGNVGASNVWRNVGLLPAAVVALGVFLQGLLPPLAARLLGAQEEVVAAAALGPVVGYGWSPFLGFRGGRGVGVSTGAAAALSPGGFLVLLAVYGLGRLADQMGLATVAGFALYAVYALWSAGWSATGLAALALLALVLLRRLEGVSEDLRHHPALPTLAGRLLLDRRPGQRLRGRNG